MAVTSRVGPRVGREFSWGSLIQTSACFVTPSYSRDFDRCRMLVESRRYCAPGIPHYIVVDPADLAQFSTLADAQTHVVDSRELLDPEFHKVWGRNGWWVSARTPPVRGWITQQLRKLAMPRLVDVDVLLNIDSDVVFIRPFGLEQMFNGDRLALFEVNYRNTEIEGWADVSAKLIGRPAPESTFNYVGMLIPWWRRQLVEMTDVIEAKHSRPWQFTVARQQTFSEYMTYGTYIRQLAGLENAAHFSDARRLVQTSWHQAINTDTGLEALFATAPPESVAVMVHSKDGVSPSDYRRHVERIWRGAGV